MGYTDLTAALLELDPNAVAAPLPESEDDTAEEVLLGLIPSYRD